MVLELKRRVTGRAGNPPGQGPFLWLTVEVVEFTIQHASFETYQCPGCIACGKAIVAMVEGGSLQGAGSIKHDDVVQEVGPLAPHRRICYGLAILALSDALNQLKKD